MADKLTTRINKLSPEKQQQVEAAIARLEAEPDPEPLPTGAEVAAAYDALPDQGKARIAEILTRLERRNTPSES